MMKKYFFQRIIYYWYRRKMTSISSPFLRHCTCMCMPSMHIGTASNTSNTTAHYWRGWILSSQPSNVPAPLIAHSCLPSLLLRARARLPFPSNPPSVQTPGMAKATLLSRLEVTSLPMQTSKKSLRIWLQMIYHDRAKRLKRHSI